MLVYQLPMLSKGRMGFQFPCKYSLLYVSTPTSLATPACPGPPQNTSLASPVPPNVVLLWERPSTPDMWSFKYQIKWQNGTTVVGDTTDTRVTLSSLEAESQYSVMITAFTDSTLCAEQSINFTFNMTQSECWLALRTNHNHFSTRRSIGHVQGQQNPWPRVTVAPPPFPPVSKQRDLSPLKVYKRKGCCYPQVIISVL